MQSGVTRSIVSALSIDGNRAFEKDVDCSDVETAPLKNDSVKIDVGISALHNHEYITPDFHTTELTHSGSRREFVWETARARLCRLSQSFLILDSSR